MNSQLRTSLVISWNEYRWKVYFRSESPTGDLKKQSSRPKIYGNFIPLKPSGNYISHLL
jgi:hypothetical protein